MESYESHFGAGPDIEFEQLTPDQQRSILETRVETARSALEQTAQDPDATDDSYEEARARKAAADQAFLDFRIAHGEINQPDE